MAIAAFVADTLLRSQGGWVLFGYPRTIRHVANGLAEYRLRVAPVRALYQASNAFYPLQAPASVENIVAELRATVVGTAG